MDSKRPSTSATMKKAMTPKQTLKILLNSGDYSKVIIAKMLRANEKVNINVDSMIEALVDYKLSLKLKAEDGAKLQFEEQRKRDEEPE